jgi:hypothetical protein
MDADAQQELIATQASPSAFVLSRGMDLALIEVTGKPDAVTHSAALLRNGYTLQGIVGLVNGRVECGPSSPNDVECMFAMGRAAHALGMMLSAPVNIPSEDPSADSIEFCKRLFALEDTRPN